MIYCPNCKEEIDDDSHYCDQCGQQLYCCERCGRVGLGRRCTACGGLMLSVDEHERRKNTGDSGSVSQGFISQGFISQSIHDERKNNGPSPAGGGMPQLMLFNDSLGIRIMGINGAIIGRRQGPYVQQFQQHKYISGVHAQLKFNVNTGWCIADKHSSNGTKLNDHTLQPDVEMSLKNGDILSLANVVLQINIK